MWIFFALLFFLVSTNTTVKKHSWWTEMKSSRSISISFDGKQIRCYYKSEISNSIIKNPNSFSSYCRKQGQNSQFSNQYSFASNKRNDLPRSDHTLYFMHWILPFLYLCLYLFSNVVSFSTNMTILCCYVKIIELNILYNLKRLFFVVIFRYTLYLCKYTLLHDGALNI